MERRHGSFLLRCWWRNDTVERIEIEHIQSGRRGLLSSVSDALTWIDSHRDAPDASGEEESAADTQEPHLTHDPANHQQ
jgi:hypothetical protein